MTRIIMLFMLALATAGCQRSINYQTGGTIERLDTALQALIAPGARVEILAKGFDWSEGPVWVPESKKLLFSDIPPNMIYQWTEQKGLELYLKPSGYTGATPRGGEPGSNGLLIDPQGKLILCQHGDRRIAVMDAPLNNPLPHFKTIADRIQGKRFNSPNDLVMDNKGNIYFTDPPYGLVKGMEDSTKETPWQGVYEVNTKGEVILLIDSLTRPNGIALSPDQRFLLVGNSDGQKPRWYKYELGENAVTSGTIFYDLTGSKEHGGPDGMKIDKNGNLFSSGPGGVWIFNASGKVLGRIHFDQAASNVALGDDEKTLYITADSLILRVNMR